MRARGLHNQGEKGSAGRKVRAAWLACALALTLASPAAHCEGGGPPNPDDSPLRKFEKGARPAPSSEPAPQAPAPPLSGSPNDGEHDDDWLGDFLDFLFSPSGGSSAGNASGDDTSPGLLAAATDLTMARLDPGTDISLRRDEGDALIPYIRYDFAYQNVSSSISGYDNRIELGYGVVSILADDYHLTDGAYGVSLTVDRYLLQYRVSVDRRSEFDFGVGETDLLGANYTRLGTVSIAARFMVADNLMLELRPTWARTVQDYEGAAAYARRGWSLKAGYRSMTSPGGTLRGPFIGFSLYD